MPYSEALAERIRPLLEGHEVREQKMFGGLTFMVAGRMTIGVVGDALMVRLGSEAAGEALARPYVRPMDFTGRPMRNMVYVDPPGARTRQQLTRWIELALAYSQRPDLKPSKPRPRRPARA